MAKLGDAEPWATIRDSLEDIVTAWRATHPGFRTAFDPVHGQLVNAGPAAERLSNEVFNIAPRRQRGQRDARCASPRRPARGFFPPFSSRAGRIPPPVASSATRSSTGLVGRCERPRAGSGSITPALGQPLDGRWAP